LMPRATGARSSISVDFGARYAIRHANLQDGPRWCARRADKATRLSRVGALNCVWYPRFLRFPTLPCLVSEETIPGASVDCRRGTSGSSSTPSSATRNVGVRSASGTLRSTATRSHRRRCPRSRSSRSGPSRTTRRRKQAEGLGHCCETDCPREAPRAGARQEAPQRDR
jgi:hypothetical protein